MPIPRVVARLNRRGLNRVLVHVAPHVPGMGLLTHRGRRSGREFVIPVNVFWTDDGESGGARFALTYGSDSDWVKNVLAAGGCRLRTRRGETALTSPVLVRDAERSGLPPLVRFVLGVIRVDEFLDLHVVVQVRGQDVRSSTSRRVA